MATLCAAAAAAEEPELGGVELEYRAPAGCPSRAQFVALMRERSGGDPGTAHIRALRVEVTRRSENGGARFFGRLDIDDLGEKSLRQIDAPTCKEASAALALIAALALRATPEDAPPADADAAEPIPESRPMIPAVAKTTTGSSSGAPGVEIGPLGQMGPPARRGWWGLGIHLDGFGGVLPQFALGPRLLVDARLDRSGGGWTPSARLSAIRVTSGVAVGDGNGALTWTAGRIDLCPSGIVLGDEATLLWPCALFETGALHEDQPPGGPAYDIGSKLWLAVGGLGRFQAIAFETLMLEMEAGLTVPLERDEFFARTDAAFTPSPVVAFVSFGVGARFP